MGPRGVRAALHGQPIFEGNLSDFGLRCGPGVDRPPSLETLSRRLRVTA